MSLCGLISCVSQHKHLLVHLSCHSITKTKQGTFTRAARSRRCVVGARAVGRGDGGEACRRRPPRGWPPAARGAEDAAGERAEFWVAVFGSAVGDVRVLGARLFPVSDPYQEIWVSAVGDSLTEPGEPRPGKPCGNVHLPLCASASQLVGSSSPLRPSDRGGGAMVDWCLGGGARVVVTCVAPIPSIHPWTT